MRSGRFPDPSIVWTERDARLALEHWRRSGDSLAGFARKRGVPVGRLYWWRSRLGREQPESSAALLSLVPAKIVSETVSDAGGIVVRLPNQIEIDLGDRSPVWLGSLIRELARAT